MDSNRVLMVATVAATIGSFNMENIRILLNMGYKVDVAADFTDESVWPAEKVNAFKELLSDMGVEYIQLNFSRSAFSVKRHIDSYNSAIKLLNERKYRLVHTHTPIASAIIRLAAHKTGTKVIYTAHGFHFYKGAPLKNWLVFYPIEKWLSKYTDVLITINKEDYARATSKFRAKRTVYVPGVGVDTEKFTPQKLGRERIRKELGLSDSQKMILSVGELNENKNHISVIKALKGSDYVYVVVGKGELGERLHTTAQECNVDLHLMGYRNDVADFYSAADLYVLPSIREGLNVSLMEAMASGLAVTCSNIRGNKDLVDSPLFTPLDIDSIRSAIEEAFSQSELLGHKNLEKIKGFSSSEVKKMMSYIYSEG